MLRLLYVNKNYQLRIYNQHVLIKKSSINKVIIYKTFYIIFNKLIFLNHLNFDRNLFIDVNLFKKLKLDILIY